MKYPINKKPKKSKGSMFLWFPQYCGKCKIGIWLERVQCIEQEGLRGICACGKIMWFNKSFALEQKEDN